MTMSMIVSPSPAIQTFNLWAVFIHQYSALRPVLAETRTQSGDWNGPGTLHPGQILRGRLPLLSPAFRHSHLLR